MRDVAPDPAALELLRDGLFYYRPGRPALIAMLVMSLAVAETEFLLLRHGLLAAAALGVAAEVALQQAWLREIRQGLRDGSGPA